MSKILIGGQAVLEGVMMRAPGTMTVAVRRQDGSIQLFRDRLNSVSNRFNWLKKPLIRGVLALGQAMVLGFRALNYSSAAAMADLDKNEGEPVKEESLGNWQLAGIISLSLVLGVGFFFLLPLVITHFMGKYFPMVNDNPFLFNAVDGVIRVVFLLAYIFSISLMPDIRRVFEYHGAEHKAIYTYEAGLSLTVENARPFTTLHPRCGTAFLLMVMVIAVIVFSMIPSAWPIWLKGVSRIFLLPVIAGISYELIRYSGEHPKGIIAWGIKPGLWLQKITTREPSDDQLEVGLEALKTALAESVPTDSDMII